MQILYIVCTLYYWFGVMLLILFLPETNKRWLFFSTIFSHLRFKKEVHRGADHESRHGQGSLCGCNCMRKKHLQINYVVLLCLHKNNTRWRCCHKALGRLFPWKQCLTQNVRSLLIIITFATNGFIVRGNQSGKTAHSVCWHNCALWRLACFHPADRPITSASSHWEVLVHTGWNLTSSDIIHAYNMLSS